MNLRPLVTTTATLALVLGAAACGNESEGASDSASSSSSASEGAAGEESGTSEPVSTDPEALAGVTVTGDLGEAPTIEVDGLEVTEPASGVVITGDGEEVAEDSVVNYRFSLVKAADGSKVSDSYADPADQQLDLSQQPPAISDGVAGTPSGSRVALAFTAADLLGEGQAKQYGLKDSDGLVMVIDLISLVTPPLDGPDGEAVDPPAGAPKVLTDDDGAVTGIDFDGADKASDELQVIPLIEGSGDEVAVGDTVTVDYYGVTYDGDEAFDESYSGEPATFGLAEGSLIDGWVQGLEGVTVGSRVMLVIPPELGYGDEETAGIPAGSTLVFVIDVLGAS